MPKISLDLKLAVPPAEIRQVCYRAFQTLRLRLVADSTDAFSVAGPPGTFTWPFEANVTIRSASSQTTHVMIVGAVSGWGPIQKNHCVERAKQLRDTIERFAADLRNQANGSKTPIEETHHAHILGLSGKVTLQDIKKQYRQRMLEYHPDKVAALGPKLRALAEEETKAINAAYEYFCAKYDLKA